MTFRCISLPALITVTVKSSPDWDETIEISTGDNNHDVIIVESYASSAHFLLFRSSLAEKSQTRLSVCVAASIGDVTYFGIELASMKDMEKWYAN